MDLAASEAKRPLSLSRERSERPSYRERSEASEAKRPLSLSRGPFRNPAEPGRSLRSLATLSLSREQSESEASDQPNRERSEATLPLTQAKRAVDLTASEAKRPLSLSRERDPSPSPTNGYFEVQIELTNGQLTNCQRPNCQRSNCHRSPTAVHVAPPLSQIVIRLNGAQSRRGFYRQIGV